MIKKAVILEVFDFLKQRGIVASESEFSMDWLGQGDSYFRGLRFKKTEPSMGAIAICSNRLSDAAEQFARSPRHHQLHNQFAALSAKCRALVNEDAVEFDLI
jgi:hypothetical protein